MSESTFSFKKAIPIIAVTWILSLVTTLAFVYVVPIILPPTWHEVATFSGTFQDREGETTDIFYISSDHWRLKWDVECEDPPPEDVEFFFIVGYPLWISETFVMPLGGTFELRRWTLEDFRASKGLGFEWLCSQDGTEYITGSGEFVVRVVGARLEWEIIVEAYY